jgi:hypothetical protein
MKLPLKRLFRAGATSRKSAPELEHSPCEAVWPLLSFYSDNEASREEAAMVEGHIAVCSSCSADLRFMQSTSVAFSTLPDLSPPSDLRTAILAATVDRPGRARQLAESFHRLLGPAPARYGFAAAAGLAGILVAVAINRGLPPAGGLNENPAVYRPVPTLAERAPATTPSGPKEVVAPAPLAVHPRLTNAAPLLTREGGAPNPFAGSAHGDAVTVAANKTVSLQPVVNRNMPAKKAASAAAPAFAAGEMKVKAPVVEGQPLPAEEGTAHTADMVVMMDPKPMSAGPEPVGGMQPMPEAGTTPAAVPRLTRIQFTSSQDMGSIATFAELKRALKHRDLEGAKAIEESIKAGEIRVPVLKRSF